MMMDRSIIPTTSTVNTQGEKAIFTVKNSPENEMKREEIQFQRVVINSVRVSHLDDKAFNLTPKFR